MVSNISILILGILGLLSIPCVSHGNTEVVQTGIASSQYETEKNNLEKLRERAIRNALDLAVMQVTGVMVSSERGDSIRTREDTVTHGDDVQEKSLQQSRFRAGATSRTEGQARLVEIIREWQENGQYFVEARIAVQSLEEIEKHKNCGDYWVQAGKPAISISFTEEFNGEISSDHQAHTLSFLRDNLNRNGVQVSSGKNANSQYWIEVLQDLTGKELVDFGTITVNCRLSFRIVDADRQESVAEYRAGHGPQAGFSLEQAKESCIKAIAPDVAENLLRSLGKVMIDRWNNGVEQKVIIADMPGGVVPEVSELLQNLYRVTSATPARYSQGKYNRTMRFKGSGADLAKSIQGAFLDEDWNVKVTRIEGGEVHLQWIVAQ